jgi:DNA-binding winged helix-turn-helix (wHTH) protein/predicted negative regulator of RcsB-dependent stress response
VPRNLRFGDFELDVAARQLRLRGRELALQPRIFDLIAYLAAHRDRVVDKNELLEAIWPRMVVTDGSLQRAVSLARNALREGGAAGVIRTYARRGYRFCVAEDAAAPTDPAAQARELIAAGRWAEAAQAYERASATLEADDLEAWGRALQCCGALQRAVGPLERAAAAHAQAGAARAAARVHITLASIQIDSLDSAVAEGHLRRAARLLEDGPLCDQHGHLAWMQSRYGVFVGDLQGAVAAAERALGIARTLADPDLEVMGKLYLGIALQAAGETRRGLELQHEAAATVVSGSTPPLLGGIVYCGLIAGCSNCGDWPRAGQWTDSFTRWCERTRLGSFAGMCLLHRAELFAVRGELERAEREVREGFEVVRMSAPWALGEAHRLLGDIHLARGELERAETQYRTAHEHGWEPYPGYARLLQLRGQSQAALRGLRRALEPTHWVAGQRRAMLTAHFAVFAARCGETAEARAALARLEALPEEQREGAQGAALQHARGEIALAQGDAQAAATALRAAVQAWRRMEAPLDAARVQLRLADALAACGDSEGAEFEASAARATFTRCGASGYAALAPSG